MNKFLFLYSFLLCGISAHSQEISIIPQPNSITINKDSFSRTNNFLVEQKGGDLANEIVFFYDMIDLIPKSNEEAMSKVVLEIDPNLKIAESYELRITESKIQISGADSHGVFYGLQTLKQIALQNQNSGLQGLVVKDAPRFSYRGMHLDVGRHFFDVDYIKTYIDLIASHKMNRFHWHLTEDQGWRIEIKKYPKLTEVAAFRKETIMGRWSSRSTRNPSYDQKPYGGYYTQDEVKEIVQYAADRHIIVIPEIEMPGHALAAISAYPNLGNTGKQYEVATRWGVFPQIYAPKEETFQFLEDVLTEVMALFPSEYIHIGGDEAPKKQWEESDFAQQLIREKGLADEHELQSYFIKRIEGFLNENGRSIIGWDEILEGGVAPNATVMSWRGVSGGIAAAKAGHQVIMTPTDACYFDYYQAEPTEFEPLAIGGFLPVEFVYNYEPVPSVLSSKEGKYILGAQGNLWSEYIKTPEQANYMILPRMTALSEVVWSSKEARDYPSFVKRLQVFQETYKDLGVNYAQHLFIQDE